MWATRPAVGNDPQNRVDPSGLVWGKKNCEVFLRALEWLVDDFWGKYRHYNPATDVGGIPFRSKQDPNVTGVTKPYSHYEKLVGQQKSIADKLKEYKKNCPNDPNDPTGGASLQCELAVNLQVIPPKNYLQSLMEMPKVTIPPPNPNSNTGTTAAAVAIAILGLLYTLSSALN